MAAGQVGIKPRLPEAMPDIDWVQILAYLGQLLAAYVLALPVALDREVESKSAGLRTYPLVAVGSCGFMLVGNAVLPNQDMNAHLMKGLIGGLGFLGGGAILKNKQGVSGMATAASIWNTGAIGMAVAYSRYEIAIVLSLLNFLTLRIGSEVKETVNGDDEEQ